MNEQRERFKLMLAQMSTEDIKTAWEEIKAMCTERGIAVPENENDRLFERYARMECETDEERESLVADVESFWERLNTYLTPQNQRAYGLAVGRVQSGKTRNYIGLMFKAIDEGYNTVIILTSKSKRLAVQTHKRVEKWFGREGLDLPNWQCLTRVRQDKAAVGVEWFGGQFSARQVQVGVVLKNERGHLEKVREWMAVVREAGRDMRLLFIDDESDSATPNTNNIADPEINSAGDVEELIRRVQDSGFNGSEDIAKWMRTISDADITDNDNDAMSGHLRRAVSKQAFMETILSNNEFKHLSRIDGEVCIDNQNWTLSRLLYDSFNRKATKRQPLNWIVLRDFFNYVFGVRQKRSRINGSICELVGQSADKPTVFSYAKMIYVGYTATPFANMLNENPKGDPLCPDCIMPLSTNSRYFGLRRIFGGENGTCNMNIVRRIEGDEYSGWVQMLQEEPENINVDAAETFKRIHNFAEEGQAVDNREVEWSSIMRAVKWAFCTAAARRVTRLADNNIDGDNAPIKYRWTTMLFNLSHLSNQDAGVHPVQQQLLQRYIGHQLNEANRDRFVEECMAVWDEETASFTGESFRNSCPGYGTYQQYPTRERVLEELQNWFIGHGGKVQVIQMNSAAGGINQKDYNDPGCEDGDVLWFVCGGNAISRGLTLEGLTVSYYDRIKGSSCVDTITQMGRWFGYRGGYELLPRIWMTPETIGEMKKICRVEESLHSELQDLFDAQEDDGNGRLRYPSIREGVNTASICYFGRRLSGRDANGVRFDGAASKRVFETVYENNAQVGFDIAREFCTNRGDAFPVQWENPDERHARHRLFWRDVDSEDIATFIARLKDEYLAGPSVYDADGLLRELDDYPGTWNVVVGNPEGNGLVRVDGDYFNGYRRRNNPIKREFGGVVKLGRQQITGVALLARVPNQYIETACAEIPNAQIGDVRHIEEVYRRMQADLNCERWLTNPILLIDFVNGDAGRLFTQVSFYWYGHSQESFFRAALNPTHNRPSVIARVIEFLDEHGYASLTCLYRRFANGLERDEFRNELAMACSHPNSRIGRVDDDAAATWRLSPDIYYSKTWLDNQDYSEYLIYAVAGIIGMSLYKRVCIEHWNWFSCFNGNLIRTNQPPRNGCGYLKYELLKQNDLEKIMAYGPKPWYDFAQLYLRLERNRQNRF